MSTIDELKLVKDGETVAQAPRSCLIACDCVESTREDFQQVLEDFSTRPMVAEVDSIIRH